MLVSPFFCHFSLASSSISFFSEAQSRPTALIDGSDLFKAGRERSKRSKEAVGDVFELLFMFQRSFVVESIERMAREPLAASKLMMLRLRGAGRKIIQLVGGLCL